MYKNLLTGLFLLGAVEIASATSYVDGQSTEENTVILRYNAPGGLEGVSVQKLTDKIIYRSTIDGFPSVSEVPALQYKSFFFQLPNQGEKFDFTTKDWRFSPGTVEGTIVNLLVGAWEDWEKRLQEVSILDQKMAGFREWEKIISNPNTGVNLEIWFSKEESEKPYVYNYSSDLKSGQDLQNYSTYSPILHIKRLSYIDKLAPDAIFGVLDTYFRNLSSLEKVQSHLALVGIPESRPMVVRNSFERLFISDAKDTGPTYAITGQFDTPRISPNGYVSAGFWGNSVRAPIQVILDTLNFAFKERTKGLTPAQRDVEFMNIVNSFRDMNFAARMLSFNNDDSNSYSLYLKSFFSVLPTLLPPEYKVRGIQMYLASRARAANLVADPDSLTRGHDEILGLSSGSEDRPIDLPENPDLQLEELNIILYEAQFTGVTTLNLDESTLGDEGAQAIAQAIQKGLPIQTLYLNTWDIGRNGAISLAKVVKENRPLIQLSLKNSLIDDQGAVALGKALEQNTNLISLLISNNDIGPTGAIALAQGLESNQTLKELSLSLNNIWGENPQEFLDSLKNNSTLESLDLSITDFPPLNNIAIAKGLVKIVNLKILNLSTNAFRDEGAKIFAESLKSNSRLEQLDLSSNEIGTLGAIALAQALEKNQTLESLALHGNPIGDEGALALLAALNLNEKVEVFLNSEGLSRDTLKKLRGNNRIIFES